MYKSPAAVATVVPARPSIRDVYPAWGALSDKYTDLCRREDAIIEQLNDIDWERGQHDYISLNFGSSSGQPVANVTYPPKPPKPVSARVRALLDGAIPDLPPTPEPAPFAPAKPIPVVDYVGYRTQESIDLGKELEDVRCAKELLLPLLNSAHLAGSKLLCEARKDEHSAVAAGVCSALIVLGEAVKAYLALTQEMSVGGPSFYHLRPVDMNLLVGAVGDPTDRNSVIRRVLASAAEGGHFDLKSVPSGLTAPPPAPVPVPEPRRRRSPFYFDKAGRIRRRADGATVGKVLTADDAVEASIVSDR